MPPLKALEEKIKTAFEEERFTDVEFLAKQILALDPANHVALKLLEKVTRLREEAQKKIQAKQEKKSEKPKGPPFWQGWFKQKAEDLKPEVRATKPDPLVLPAEPKKETPAPGAGEPKKEMTGNIFTRMFGAKEAAPPQSSKSIIETIVSKTGKEKKQPPQKTLTPLEEKRRQSHHWLQFSKGFFKFTVFFILASAAFFYIENHDTENRFLGLIGKESYAARLHQASLGLEDKEEMERKLEREINVYNKGYNNRYEEIITQIVAQRPNWNELLKKINEITDSVYERNALSQYIQYESFSFDAEKGIVRVSGTLSDPLGKNLTKLAELEQAFRFFPKNPENVDDKREPYFYDISELTSLRKSFDKRTGRYTSSFQLSFSLEPAAPVAPPPKAEE